VSRSTTFDVEWRSTRISEFKVAKTDADASFTDDFFVESYVTVVRAEELGLLWPMKLTIERDGNGFIVSDDLTEAYGEGGTKEEALTAYREALVGLRRVLASRVDELSDELKQRLAVLLSIVPPAE